MRVLIHTAVPLLVALVCILPGCATPSKASVCIHMLNAGSLEMPLAALEPAFEAAHPEIDLTYEGHGSIQVIRHITEIGDMADLAAVADQSLFPILMYPARTEDGATYADWHIQFSSNRLGIAYTDESQYADEIDTQNWHDIIRREDVRIALADPRLDASGYRTLMLAQLAEDYYQDPTLFYTLVTKNFNRPIEAIEVSGGYLIDVPELLESRQKRILLRGFSVQIIALLETREVDYAFLYESVARQQGFKFLALPEEIDLSSPQFAENYARVTVNIDFRRFKSVTPEFIGHPIVYGITIPNNAPHPAEAAIFIDYLLGPEGSEILAEYYQPILTAPRSDAPERVPQLLQKYIK